MRSPWMAVVASLLLASCAVSPPRPPPTPRSTHEVHVRFVDGAIDAFVNVGDVLVVDPPGLDGVVELGNGADRILRQDGEQWRFKVIAVGTARLTLHRSSPEGGSMVIYVRM